MVEMMAWGIGWNAVRFSEGERGNERTGRIGGL
jgi:hypothetical protein